MVPVPRNEKKYLSILFNTPDCLFNALLFAFINVKSSLKIVIFRIFSAYFRHEKSSFRCLNLVIDFAFVKRRMLLDSFILQHAGVHLRRSCQLHDGIVVCIHPLAVLVMLHRLVVVV